MNTISRRLALKGFAVSSSPWIGACRAGDAQNAAVTPLNTELAANAAAPNPLPPLAPAFSPTPTPAPTPAPPSPSVTLGFDRATPEQISLRCPIIGPLHDRATAVVQYRLVGAAAWMNAGPLYRLRLADLGPLPPALQGQVTDSFVGWIVELQPGHRYEIGLLIQQPGRDDQWLLGERATRSLPAPPAPSNKTCTPINFKSVLASLVPGDHLRMAAGSYALNATLTALPSGTAERPIYITAATLGDVVITRARGTLLAPNSDHVVFERLRFVGSNQDSGTQVLSKFCVPDTARRNKAWTFRFCDILGFDAAIKCYEPVDDFLVYDCLLRGNNPWEATFTDPINQTWDDSGLQFPGSGNAVFNNTISGFGDTFRCHTSSGLKFTAANYYWRNRVEWGGDDTFEADDSAGNVAAYDNLMLNGGSVLSVDGTFGPTGFFRNVCINTTRGPIKVTSSSINTRILNNTFVIGAKSASSAHGLLTPSAADQLGLAFCNNLFVYSGPGNVVHWSSPLRQDRWSHNAWTAGALYIKGAGSWPGLAQARVGHPTRFANDVLLPSQPFAQPVVLGPDYRAAFVGNPSAALAAVSEARAAGVPIAGVTTGHVGLAPDMGAYITGRQPVAYGRRF